MIEIFPERMLDGSIHTAILVGVLVLWLMTETLGFAFAGFVVAGYLAAIALVAPMSLVAILVEAVLTYGLTWALATGAGKAGLWSRLFGRERFLLFVILSVPVRLFVEGYAAPGFEWLLQPLVDDPAWRGSRFFGIGLVLVPLTANTFWKPGLARGLVQVALSAGTTVAVLKFVLMPLTNFQLGGFELIFERVAVDFLETPKAYVILLVTAFIAAHNNLRFNWDFGGILVPALIAITALEPVKLLITIAEIVVLVWVYRGVVALPWVRDLNLEGPRRIVSMYVVSYGLKWLLAILALRLGPDVHVSDLYGFGYLMTSLVAVRCYNKKNTARTLNALLVTAGQGFVAAMGLSLALSWLMPPPVASPDQPIAGGVETPIARSVLTSYASVRTEYPSHEGAESEYEAWVRAVEWLARGESSTTFGRALAGFAELGAEATWAVRPDAVRCLSVRSPRPDVEAPAGLPSLWWCGGSGPGLFVPSPVGDPDSLWSAAWLAEQGLVSFVVVAGVDDAHTALLGVKDPRQQGRWQRLRDALGSRTVLVLRTVARGGSWLDPRSSLVAPTLSSGGADPLSQVPVRFEADHGALEPLWQLLRRQDGLLTLSVAEIAATMDAPEPVGALEDVLLDVRTRKDVRREDPSTPAHRLTVAEVLLNAAVRAAREGRSDEAPLAWLADRLGVTLWVAEDADGRHWILDETDTSPEGFGTWVIRPSATGPWFVGVPFSTDERGAAEIATVLYQRLRAESLWISGHGRRFGVANPLSDDLRDLPVAQLMMREILQPDPDPTATGPAARVLLVRRQQREIPGTPTLVLAEAGEAVVPGDVEDLRARLGPHLVDWPGYGFVTGEPTTVALNASAHFPVQYVAAMTDDAAVVAWFAPDVLGEVEGSAQRAGRLVWYTHHGVPVVRRTREEMEARLDPDAPIPPRPGTALLEHHVQALDDASVEALATEGSSFAIWDTGTRLVGTLSGDGWACTATTGAPPGAWPWHGCWRTR